MSCGSVLMPIAWSLCYLLLSVVLTSNATPTELPSDFMKFVQNIGSYVFNRKEDQKADVVSELPYVHLNTPRITTSRSRAGRIHDDIINSEKDALRDVLMMKLVSYYEDKYKLSHSSDNKFNNYPDYVETNKVQNKNLPIRQNKYRISHADENKYKSIDDKVDKDSFFHDSENKYKFDISNVVNDKRDIIQDKYRISKGDAYSHRIPAKNRDRYRIAKDRIFRQSNGIRDTQDTEKYPKKLQNVKSKSNIRGRHEQQRITRATTPHASFQEDGIQPLDDVIVI